MKGSEEMKKLVILIVIGAMIALFSIKPIENVQPKTVTIKQNIGLPSNVVTKLNELINP